MELGKESNFSDPHEQYCYKLFIKCHLTSNGLNVTANCQTECCRNLHRQCNPYNNGIHDQLELTTILLVVYILIAVVSFLANGFVCLVYSLCKEIRTAKHYFMLNLATADVLIALFAIPFYLTQYVKNTSKTLCHIGSMVDVLCCTSSIISFTVISAERFVAVKYPLRYQTIVSRKRCLIVLCVAWAYSIVFSLASWIPAGGKLRKHHCVFFTDAYFIFTTFSSFVLPLIVMLLTYGWIYKVASYQARQINSSIPRGINRMQREFKAAKTLTLIIGAFVVCWLPFFCYIWVFTIYKVKVPFQDLDHLVQVVRYLNSLANPFIYVGINRQFRRSTLKLLKSILPCRERRASQIYENTHTTEVVLRKISATSMGSPRLGSFERTRNDSGPSS